MKKPYISLDGSKIVLPNGETHDTLTGVSVGSGIVNNNVWLHLRHKNEIYEFSRETRLGSSWSLIEDGSIVTIGINNYPDERPAFKTISVEHKKQPVQLSYTVGTLDKLGKLQKMTPGIEISELLRLAVLVYDHLVRLQADGKTIYARDANGGMEPVNIGNIRKEKLHTFRIAIAGDRDEKYEEIIKTIESIDGITAIVDPHQVLDSYKRFPSGFTDKEIEESLDVTL